MAAILKCTTHENIQTTTLNRTTLMFPLALVLFEFAVYIGNDLIQPAMLAITEDFGVSATWAPSSMSFYLLGGASVAWLLGPLSDRLGRKSTISRSFILCSMLFFNFTDDANRAISSFKIFCRVLV